MAKVREPNNHRQVIPPGAGGRERPVLPPAQMGTVMPRFYFHIDDDRTHIDHVGVELPDLEAAHAEAVCATAPRKIFGAENLGACGLRSRLFAKEKPLFVLRFSATEE